MKLISFMTNMQDIRTQSDKDLVELAQKSREAVREERFKDKFSKNASTIRSNKKDIARSLTELNARRNSNTK